MGSSQKGLWSWLVLVLVGVLVAACGSNLVPSEEGYEVVGMPTLSKVMAATECSQFTEDMETSGRTVLVLPTADGGRERYDCTGIAPSTYASALKVYFKKLAQYRPNSGSSQQQGGGGGGDCSGPQGIAADYGSHWECLGIVFTAVMTLYEWSEWPFFQTNNLPANVYIEWWFDELGGNSYRVNIMAWEQVPDGCHAGETENGCGGEGGENGDGNPPGGGGSGSGGGGGGGGGSGWTPSSISVDGPDTVYVGEDVTYTAQIHFANSSTGTGTNVWSTSSSSVLQSNGNGLFTPLVPGTVSVSSLTAGLTGTKSGIVVLPMFEAAVTNFARPTCPAVRSAYGSDADFERAKRWCTANELDTNRKNKILAATAKIRAKGGVCDTLANVIDSVLAHNDIRYNNVGTAFSQQNGGVNGFMYLRQMWLDQYYDSNHKYNEPTVGAIDLQWILAHEADHLLNKLAPDGDPHLDPYTGKLTVNNEACGRST